MSGGAIFDEWETKMSADGSQAKVIWGSIDEGEDDFDPVTQIARHTVRISGSLKGKRFALRERVLQRFITVGELTIAARVAGLEVAALYGALDPTLVDINSGDALRLVAVLRRPGLSAAAAPHLIEGVNES